MILLEPQLKMTPAEYALKLPEWVIPEGTNLCYLTHELKVLLEEFRREVVFISPEDGYRYSIGGNPYPHRYVCMAAEGLRCSEMLKVLDALRLPDFELARGEAWTIELCLGIWPELPEARAIRLEWLKLLERKLNNG